MRHKLDKALFDRARYKSVLTRLRHRAHAEPRFLRSSALYPDLSLYWVFMHEGRVLREIFAALRSGQPFNFSAQKWAVLKTDKERNFYIADWPERILLMVMAEILKEEMDHLVPKTVYSFRKGVGSHRALRNFVDYTITQEKKPLYVLKRDVQSYGDSISHQKLMAFIQAKADLLKSTLFLPLLEKAIRISFRTTSEMAETCMCLGIPSGSPLVPQLENLFLVPLDEKLMSYPNAFYGRYGDDFIFATPSREDAVKAAQTIDSEMERLGLRIKPEKKRNYFFTYHTHEDFSDDAEFQGAVRIEWLGASILAKGRLGCKRAHFESVHNFCRTEIRDLIARLAKIECDQRIKEKALSKGVRELLDPKNANAVTAVLYNHQNYEVTKVLDQQFTATTVWALRRYWKLKHREAWQTYRRLKLPSVFYIRMQQLNNRRKKAA